MRVLFLSATGDSLGLAQRVVLEGHHVDFYTPRTYLRGAGAGLFAQVPEWRPALLRADFTVVDGSGWGAHEETLRATGRPFLGAGRVLELALGSQRERAALLSNCGINDAWTNSSGSGPETFSGSVTVCSEGWFNGTDFARPFVHALMSTRLLNGDLGPQVQSQGAIVRRTDGDNLTAQTVERLTPFLRHIGHRGPVSIESAVVADAAYAVGVLAGFRFDAVEAMVEGLGVPLTSFLFDCAIGTCREFELSADAMMAVRLTVPPWPYGAGAGAGGASTVSPSLVNGVTDENIRHLFLCGVGRGEDGIFYTTEGGMVLKATAIGRTTPPREGRPADYTREARRRVYRALAAIECADKQYRTDVGVGANESILQLQQWGWL